MGRRKGRSGEEERQWGTGDMGTENPCVHVKAALSPVGGANRDLRMEKSGSLPTQL